MTGKILDIAMADYLADPCDEPSVTSSIVRGLITTTPRRVWWNTQALNPDYEDKSVSKFDLGTAAHTALTGVGEPIEIIDADDWRTKAAKDAREDAMRQGKTPLLRGQFDRVNRMHQEALDQIAANEAVGPTFDAMAREQTIVWRESGVWCRARPDFWDTANHLMVHYKTTDTALSAHTVARFAASQGWDLTAEHYNAAARSVTGVDCRQIFMVQEVSEPHLMLFVELGPVFYGEAELDRKRALTIWGKCLSSGNWPGHPSRTIMVDAPEWHEAQRVEARAPQKAAEAAGKDLLDYCTKWQAPTK